MVQADRGRPSGGAEVGRSATAAAPQEPVGHHHALDHCLYTAV